MAYQRVTWVDGQTALSAEHMNNIEDGIGEAKTVAETQVDWNQTDNTQIDYIKNRPDFVYGVCGGTGRVSVSPNSFANIDFPLPETLQGYQSGYRVFVRQIVLNSYQGDPADVAICSYTVRIVDARIRVYNPSSTVTTNVDFDESYVSVFGFKNVAEAE